MLIGCTFLCIAFTIAISIFIVLNRTTHHQKMATFNSYFANARKADDQNYHGTQRPMVQFYPDNQQRHLFQKVKTPPEHSFKTFQAVESDHNAKYGDDHMNKDNYEIVLKSKLNLNKTNTLTKLPIEETVSYKVHVFYYAWYANPKFDGDWLHWNHEYISNWNKEDTRKYPAGIHNPNNNDIGANFYPQLGCYSSADDNVISDHMYQIKKAGIGVLILSWYPPHKADEHGRPVDRLLPKLLDAADKLNLKVALHIEPYQNRSAVTLQDDLKYVVKTYASHRAFYKVKLPGRTKALPMYYIYDSYVTSANEWSRLLSRTGDLSVRDTELDGVFIGLLVDFKHRTDLKNGGFDGFYTYFAANGFSHGSSWKSWRNLNMFSKVCFIVGFLFCAQMVL
jgi:glycoprotein endo-alpha-1,2-mannosidase